MTRPLLRSTAFIRAARRVLRRRPRAVADLQTALEQLERDAFHEGLRTHRLKGNLTGSWACRAGFDLRIVFKFTTDEGVEAILLQTVGTHEEVY